MRHLAPENWERRAACLPPPNSGVKYTGFTELPAEWAKVICDACPVREQCVIRGESEPRLPSYIGDANPIVWGGKTPRELIGDRKCQRCKKHRAVLYCGKCLRRMEIVETALTWDGTLSELAEHLGRRRRTVYDTLRAEAHQTWRDLLEREAEE